MKLFQINTELSVVCTTQKTRNGFRHTATLFINGTETATAKVNYQNRTWESYEYETALNKIASSKTLTETQRLIFLDYIKHYDLSRSDFDSELKTVSFVARIGDVLCEDTKSKNDWKIKMLKAGLNEKGLDIPEDWDTLTEKQKEERLDSVIDYCKQGGK